MSTYVFHMTLSVPCELYHLESGTIEGWRYDDNFYQTQNYSNCVGTDEDSYIYVYICVFVCVCRSLVLSPLIPLPPTLWPK